MKKLTVPPAPCGSCPYAKATPPGVWAAEEYVKLELYDAETWAQPPNVFLCHQRTGDACKGWLACHGYELLAYRLACVSGSITPSSDDLTCDVPLHASGAEAAAFGMAGIDEPPDDAIKVIDGLTKKLKRRRT